MPPVGRSGLLTPVLVGHLLLAGVQGTIGEGGELVVVHGEVHQDVLELGPGGAHILLDGIREPRVLPQGLEPVGVLLHPVGQDALVDGVRKKLGEGSSALPILIALPLADDTPHRPTSYPLPI